MATSVADPRPECPADTTEPLRQLLRQSLPDRLEPQSEDVRLPERGDADADVSGYGKATPGACRTTSPPVVTVWR